MNADIIDAEHTALAVHQPQNEALAPTGLFGTNDPVAVITQATRVADALKAIVVQKRLVSVIQGKEYPQVEAWQTLAVMLGLATICEWTKPVENGWEARVIVQRNGQTIAAAEAQCLRTERTKKGWEDYALRSMAQTRSVSKALRSALGFVMVLAGYQATPAEEMPDDAAPAPQQPRAPQNAVQEVLHRRQAEKAGDSDDARALGISALQKLFVKHGQEAPPASFYAGFTVEQLRATYAETKAGFEASNAPGGAARAESQPMLLDDATGAATGQSGGPALPPDGGPAPSEASRKKLFACLNDLGMADRESRLGWAQGFGGSLADCDTFGDLSQAQVNYLIERAEAEVRG